MRHNILNPNYEMITVPIYQTKEIPLVGPVEKQIGSCGLTGGESMPAGGIDSAPE